MAKHALVRFTIPQAEAALEMLCLAIETDDKEHDIAVYERAAGALGDALAEARKRGA